MTRILETPFKSPLELKRYPHRKRELLLPWDSADELILEHLSRTEHSELRSKRILIVNDQFGALSCALEGFDITSYTDSFVAAKATQLNSQNRITPLHDLASLSGKYDLVLIRIPKNMSFFEDLLCHLSAHLHSASQVICGYMVKHQAKTAFDHLNRLIGTTRTSLAQKKARLIFAGFERAPSKSPYPIQLPIESFDRPFLNPSNLFSREKLDIGTRFFLEQLPQGDYRRILDLGCANGIIGIAAKKLNPAAALIFSDESAMAVQSAQTNYEAYFPGEQAKYVWTNCYENQEAASLDLVLCNPPFHQGNTLGDHIAWQMFNDAHHALRPGGLIRVIGNSHLRYERTLEKIFGNHRVVARNPKFTIVDAER